MSQGNKNLTYRQNARLEVCEYLQTFITVYKRLNFDQSRFGMKYKLLLNNN